MPTNKGHSHSVDVVILTAIPLEYNAALEVQAGACAGTHWEEERRPNGLRVAFRSYQRNRGRPLRVALAVAGDMGGVAAITALLPLVEEYNPQCIAMCGVCAGRPGKTNLGDVIAPDRLFFHDTGKKSPDGVKQDLTTYNLRADLKEDLKRFDFTERFRNEDWWKKRPVPYEWQENWALMKLYEGVKTPWMFPDFEQYCPQWRKVIAGLWESGYVQPNTSELTDLGRQRVEGVLFLHQGQFPDLSPTGKLIPFRVHVEPMGSGSQIIEDVAYWGKISEYMRKAMGLEMEAAAVGALAHSQPHRKLDALVMKAVMDFANDGRDDHFKPFAARASAECLLAFLREHLELEVIPSLDDILSTGSAGEPLNNAPPSTLLHARHEIIPFRGRDDTLAKLDHWCDEGPSIGLRLLYADGGVGKTRLAIEWVRRRQRQGWVAGFLPKDAPDNWFNSLWGLGQPLLIVIDYAESHPELRRILLRVLQYSEQKERGALRRMRFLLLARNAGDWWQLLQSDSRLGALLGPGDELPALALTEAERVQVFQEAAAVFAAKLGKRHVPSLPAVSLDDNRFKRVLYLHMAALASVEQLAFEANTLMDVILDHEERFWEIHSRQSTAEFAVQRSLARQVITAATLLGGFAAREDAEIIVSRILGRPIFGDEDALLRLLNWVYQRTSNASAVFLPALEPDLLGEGMVLRVASVTHSSGDRVSSNWITRVFPPDEISHVVSTGMEVLGRASVMLPAVVRPWIEQLLAGPLLLKRARLALEAAKAVGLRTAFSVIGDVLADRLEAEGSIKQAHELEEAGIPYPTLSLARVAEWSSRIRLQSLPVSHEDLSVLAEQARLLNQQGVTLIQAGRRQEALNAVEKAVGIYRGLAKSDAKTFQTDLAMSLSNLGNMLGELGRWGEAQKVTEEAVEIYRGLAELNSIAYQPDLAMSLNNLGNKLSEHGRHEDALKALNEAVEIYRRLAELNSDAYLLKLAISLNNLSPTLSALGKQDDALKAVEESVHFYRKLAKRNADAVQSNLAGSLANLGNRLSGLGRHEEAMKALDESVGIYRRLAERNAKAHQPMLAMSLNNLSTVLSGLLRWDEALKAVEEAVGIYRMLIHQNAGAYQSDLAMSLNNLGNMIISPSRQEEALKALQESVELYRRLAERNPHAYQPRLAMSLNNLGRKLCELHQWNEALSALNEAVERIWPFFERRPSSFAPHIKPMLSILRALHEAMQRPLSAELRRRIEAVEHLTHA